jgi:O-antigen/teichoic acid export membrane protein
MRIGKQTVVYFLSQVTVSLMGFIATFLIARLLGADVLGKYVLAVAILFWLTIPANAVSSALQKRLSEGFEQGQVLSAGLAIGLILGVVLFGVVLVAGPFVNGYVGADVSLFVAVTLFGSVLFTVVRGMLVGLKRVGASGGMQAVEQVIRTLTQVALIVAGYGLSGLLFGHAFSLFVIALVAGLLTTRIAAISLRTFDRSHIHRLGSYARYSWLGAVHGKTLGWMDTVVLGFFVSSSLIGIYEVAWSVSSALTLLSISVQQTLFPQISQLDADADQDQIHQLFDEGLVFIGIFTIPGLFGAAVLGPRILRIYGPEFADGATVLVILIVARIVAEYGSQFVNVINALDRPDAAFRINLAFVGANLVLNVVLISQFGWVGAASATTLSSALTLVLGYRTLATIVGIPSVPVREILTEFVAAVLMAVVLFGLLPVVPPSHHATVALVGVGALVYTLLLVIFSKRVRRRALGLLPLPG